MGGMHTQSRCVMAILGILLLVACGDTATRPATIASVAPAPTTQTIAPSATPVPATTFAANSQVAGIDVSGLQLKAASAKIRSALEPLQKPLDITLADTHIALDPKTINFQVPTDDLLQEAEAQAKDNKPVQVPLRSDYDAAPLRTQLDELAKQVAVPGSIDLITSTKSISRSFVYRPGQRLDIDAALKTVEQALQTPTTRQVTLSLSADNAPGRVDFSRLQEQIEAMAAEWKGVVGIALYDLKSNQTLVLNEKTVFSGASVMKIPIMLQTYLSVPSFDADEEAAMSAMIEKSDNLAANLLLAHVAGGEGTDDALEGVRTMNKTLEALGLEHTYQNLPYEAGEYLIKVRKMVIPKGPAKEGPAPYTEPDPYVRTTPAEMMNLLVWIEQCAQGQGPLLERFGSSLSATRCKEMIARLERNDDTTRMVAGLPPDIKVAHKSGWIEDMQADVGLVPSPAGDFVLAIYLFQPQKNSYLADEVAAPVIASFARLVYSAYDPELER